MQKLFPSVNLNLTAKSPTWHLAQNLSATLTLKVALYKGQHLEHFCRQSPDLVGVSRAVQ